MPLHIGFGNDKIDGSIALFDLPVATTCPGARECLNHCYAMKQEWWGRGRPVLRNRVENLKETWKTTFVDDMVTRIKAKKVRVFRPHESGDFYAQPYLDDWIEIAKRCPETNFFAYSKSLTLDFSKLPANFTVVKSFGGKHDHLIDKSKDNYARVVPSISRKTVERGEYFCPAVRVSGLRFEKFCGYNCSYCLNAKKPPHRIRVVFHQSMGGWSGIRLAPRPRIVRPPQRPPAQPPKIK